jgi:hypothetical protein
MCLLWVATILWGHLMQVVGLQLMVAKSETTFSLQINTITHQKLGGWDLTSLMHYFPRYWCPPPRYGQIYNIFLDDKRYDVLLEISLDVHVFTLSQCWQVFWAAMGCMCNVNMCITFYKRLCYVGSYKSSFNAAHGVRMKFNLCWNVLKPLNFSDNRSHYICIKSIVIFSFMKFVVVAWIM